MRQDIVDILKTSHMDLIRALIGQPPFALHCWCVVHLKLKAVFLFRYICMCVHTGRFRCALEVFIMVAWYSRVYLVVFPLPSPPTIMGMYCCVCLFVYQFVYVLTLLIA